jgi:hypothetical protein
LQRAAARGILDGPHHCCQHPESWQKPGQAIDGTFCILARVMTASNASAEYGLYTALSSMR